MSATKTLSALIAAGTSNAAAGTTTGTAKNTSTAYGGAVTVKLTNGATAPTVAAQAHVKVSGDNTNWKTLCTFYGDIVNNSVNEFAVDINPGYQYVNVVVDSNTVQPVTCEAFFHELTTV
jgi:hypothetical protein